MANSSYGCSLCWEPSSLTLGQADDDWMSDESQAAAVVEASSDGAFDHLEPLARSCSECPSPCRNLESPLDQTDLNRFQLRTAELAAGVGRPPISGADCKATVPRSVISTPLDQWSLVAIYQSLEERLADLEGSLVQLFESYELEILEMRNLLTQVGESITREEIRSQATSSSLTDVSIEGDEVAYELDGLGLMKQVAPLEASPLEASILERYVQKWHAGGLIIVEKFGDQARMRDIHALFNSFGSITYLELHGADKSRPHINTRHAYIHFAEYSQAVKAHQNIHGHTFQNQVLMVFLLSTSTVRGEPGKPYVGPALEVLNFAGGLNYASPEADCLRDVNEDLTQLFEVLDPTGPNTHSLKPILPTNSAASSWRRPSVSGTAIANDADLVQGYPDNDVAVLSEIQPLPMRQAGAYVPPPLRKRKASAVVDTDDNTTSSRPHPAMKILKRGEPLLSENFKSGMVQSTGSDFKRLDIKDFVYQGKKKMGRFGHTAVDDDSDDEEGGVRLL
ncbi:MAG: hypothetical protein Q9186_001549 [Xanthomendoza sp. 1 TL-2023]